MIWRIIADIFLIIGCFFAFAGTVGLIRMPDAYTRMQSSTNITTLGIIGVVIGAAIHGFRVNNALSTTMGVKVILIGVFIVLTSPVAGHAICKAAYKYGIRPEGKMACDEYGRDNPNE
jgi:multicomponent Na+:H+ antiporter subunit G